MNLSRHALLLFVVSIVTAQPEEERSENMNELQEKASAFKNQFVSLTSDALDLQCKQLEAARASGHTTWLEKRGPDGTSVSDHLDKLCEALKSRQPGRVQEVAQGETEWAKDLGKAAKDKANFYQASALGCNTLLKAQNDGKMEWFETKNWYKKTLEMCESLSQRSPIEVGDTPIELLKNFCSKTEHAPPAVHEKPWFVKSQQLCSTVSGGSDDDLRSMLKRLEMQAESGSGQLIKETCSKLSIAKQQGALERYELGPWYRTAVAMCSKMGSREVHASGLERKCAWLDYAKRTGKLHAYMGQPWYQNLVKTCSWMKNKGSAGAASPAASPSSVFV